MLKLVLLARDSWLTDTFVDQKWSFYTMKRTTGRSCDAMGGWAKWQPYSLPSFEVKAIQLIPNLPDCIRYDNVDCTRLQLLVHTL